MPKGSSPGFSTSNRSSIEPIAPEKKHAPDRRHEPTLMWDQKSEGLQIPAGQLPHWNERLGSWSEVQRFRVHFRHGPFVECFADRKPSHFVDQLGVGLPVPEPLDVLDVGRVRDADAHTFPVGSAAVPGTIRSEWGMVEGRTIRACHWLKQTENVGGAGGQIGAQSG